MSTSTLTAKKLRKDANKPGNQRKVPRKTPRGCVKVEWRYGSSGESWPAQFLDVSEGGLRIVVGDAIRDQKVAISISGPNLRKPIKCFANVIWSLPLDNGSFCVGLEFQRRLSFAEFLQIAVQAETTRNNERLADRERDLELVGV